MARAAPPVIAFIGFGEVGQVFAAGFRAGGVPRLRAFDILFGTQDGLRLETAAQRLGVEQAGSLADLCHGADYVFSAVTADRAEAAATQAAACLKPSQVLIDINSAAPATKARAAAIVLASGADYLEAAVMGPVRAPGLKVAILTGGPKAEPISAALNALGMNMTAVFAVYGRASATKLCRSIVIKGLEALMVDCAAAGESWDVKDEVFASLNATFPSIDFHALAEDMRERVATHGLRRAAEMREAGEMLAAAGLDPTLALAVAESQQRGARARPATRSAA